VCSTARNKHEGDLRWRIEGSTDHGFRVRSWLEGYESPADSFTGLLNRRQRRRWLPKWSNSRSRRAIEARIARCLVSALTVFDMHTLSPGTLSPAFSVLSDPVFTVISVCVGAAENTSVYVPVDIVAFIFFVFLFIYTDWISVFACVAEQACGMGWHIHRGSRVRRWEGRRQVRWLVWIGVRVVGEGERYGSRRM
jgi:hypothetical protein